MNQPDGNSDLSVNLKLDAGEFELAPPPRPKPLRARLSPLNEYGQPLASWTVVVVELSERTIAFKHFVPLAARHVMVTFEKRGMSTHSLEVELTWCRFDHTHQYTSGGRFVVPTGRTA